MVAGMEVMKGSWRVLVIERRKSELLAILAYGDGEGCFCT